MKAKDKLKELIHTMERNLKVDSRYSLPILREILESMEEEKIVEKPDNSHIKIGDRLHKPNLTMGDAYIDVTKDNIDKIKNGKEEDYKEDIHYSATIEELRYEYKARYNKKAFNGWDKETLLSKLTNE